MLTFIDVKFIFNSARINRALHFRQNSMFRFTLYIVQSTLHFLSFIWVCLCRPEHELYWIHDLFIPTWRWCFFDRRQTVSYAQESGSHLASTSRCSSILAIGGHHHTVVNRSIDVWFVGSGEGPLVSTPLGSLSTDSRLPFEPGWVWSVEPTISIGRWPAGKSSIRKLISIRQTDIFLSVALTRHFTFLT